MATVVTLLSDLATAVQTLVGGARYASDYRTDLEKIQSGNTRYQIRGAAAGSAQDSNVTYQRAQVQISVHYALPGSERTYTEGAMQTHHASLLSLAWWRAIASVHEILIDDAPQVEIERVGKVITYTVTATVTLDP